MCSKKREVQYRQGLETGIATDFFPNGQKQQEISFVNGVEHALEHLPVDQFRCAAFFGDGKEIAGRQQPRRAFAGTGVR